MAAELLLASGSAYARCVSNRLLTNQPELNGPLGLFEAFDWTDYFCERIRELAAAMQENEPALFASRIRWSQEAFHAREVSDDVLRLSLNCLGETLREELPSACQQEPGRYVAAALQALESNTPPVESLEPSDPSSKLAMQYLLKILEGDSQDAIQSVVDAHNNGLSIEETYYVLMSALNEIGKMWHGAEANIAEEHLVTSTTRRAMAILAFRTPRPPAIGRTVVATAVQGNAHDIGVRAVADFFEFAGWRSVCLGGDLPSVDVAQAVKFFDASLVLLSAALSTHLKAVRETVEAIRELNSDCKIIVGGTAFHETPELWRQLGVDAYATTLAEAVEIGTQVTNS